MEVKSKGMIITAKVDGKEITGGGFYRDSDGTDYIIIGDKAREYTQNWRQVGLEVDKGTLNIIMEVE